MKIGSYNIYKGAKAKLPLLEEFVRQNDLDILCLQETNDWLEGSPSLLERFAATSGLINVIAGGKSDYKVATLSRLPYVKTTVHTDAFFHGAVEAEVETPDGIIDIWNTHLFPFSEDKRVGEIEYIANHMDHGKQMLVVGDFNSLSEVDEYPEDFARNYNLTATEKNKGKFGVDQNRYDVTGTLPRYGLYDIAALMEARTHTAPTPVNIDKAHSDKLRLDYMFATSSLIKKVKDYRIPKDTLTDRISDHYPQVLEIAD